MISIPAFDGWDVKFGAAERTGWGVLTALLSRASIPPSYYSRFDTDV